MPENPLIARLLDPHQVIVFDGAMGTMLYNKGVFINQCYDELNLSAPDLVRDVHKAYKKAGAEVLETNTFGANRTKLAQYGLEGQVAEINRAAARIAREVADDDVLVAGAVGPLGVRLEPFGPTSLDEARAVFREQLQALKDGGCDLFILETFADLHEIEQAILAAHEVDPTIPVIAQMTIGSDCHTPYGVSVEDIAQSLDAFGADVIGLNCSVGPQIILDAIEKMVLTTRRKLSAQPNAGMPRDVSGRSMYMASPEYMATYAHHLVQAGAKIVGGCCGTTPEHIAAMVEGVRPLSPRQPRVPARERRQAQPDLPPEDPGVQPVPLAERSKWGGKIARGEFVTSVEIVPPRGVDATRMLADTARLRQAGVDAVNVPDGPRAQSRMGALLTSVLIEQQVGIETVIHYCCRDRNLLGMLSDLLGAAAVGLRNLLLITGDPPKMGPYPNATAVFDIDAIGLTNLVNQLNHGLDPGGNAIGAPTKFTIGVGVNPAALDPAQELKRFEWKVEAGAEYAITQPVFDVEQLETFLGTIEHTRIPIVAGIWPLVSLRNAEFLANEVPGVVVPPRIIERMRAASAKSKEHGVQEGIAIAREMLERVKPHVQGVQVSAPFGKVELALDVFRDTRARRRQDGVVSATEIFLSRSRYWLVKEYPIKLRHCVNALPRAAVWTRPDDDSNSIGNLLVHLAGNVTEWILGGVGGQSITRYRAGEFDQKDGPDAATLLDNLEAVLRKADTVLAGLTAKDLERSIVIQGRETTVLGAVYHVVEHFAMHTGQIVLLTKMYAPGQIHFYEDAGGLAQPTWHRGSPLDEAAH